jgi:hypothetical protein
VSVIGHNSGDIAIAIEVKLFNSTSRFDGGRGGHFPLTVPVGTTVAELINRLGIPRKEVFLVFVNGRDISPGMIGDALRGGYEIEEGDTIAFTGPIPYSWGYGAPVV